MNIKNLTLNINIENTDNEKLGEVLDKPKNAHEAREMLIDILRCASFDEKIIGQKIIIPDDCEKYGFVQGNFDLSVMIHFLADMLE